MTNKRIEALKGRVRECMNSILTGPYLEVLEEGYRALDELCAVARQPESLVGKRVKFRTPTTEPPIVRAISYKLEFADGFTGHYDRDDFELLEDEQPAKGVWRCESCGEMLDELSGKWRMAGDRWQHSHGQAGHIDAKYFGETLEDDDAK